MKKLLVIGALVFAASSVHAQNLSFGPTASFGHSWSSIDAPDGVDKMFHPSYSVGGKLVYSFVSNWGVSADVKFSSEGFTVGTDGDNKIVARANYIRVPLQGIYFFGKYGDAVRPKVSLGPSFGFLVGGQTRSFDEGDEVAKVDSKDNMESFDFGVTAAAGVNFRIAPTVWLNTDIGYYHGFLDAFNTNVDAKNRNLALNVGVTFGIGTVKAK